MTSAEKTKAFKDLAKTASLPDPVMVFLEGQGICSIEDMALAASSEDDVTVAIIDMAVAAKVKFEKLSDKVATKKLWLACRKHMETKKDSAKKNETEADEPMPDENAEDIADTWGRIHGVVLPDDWLLAPTLQGKMWRARELDKPRVDVLLAEHLRRMSNTEKSAMGTVMTSVPGKPVETQVVYADSVTRPIELYLRCRAWFVTMAYISIKDQTFMDFQTALFASDKVLGHVTQSIKGHYAPMTFYVAAWAGTLHHFSEAVRIQRRPLKEIILNLGTWEHKWTNWTPLNDSQNNAGADLPKSVQEEMTRLRVMVKDWQKKADGYRGEFENYKRRQDNFNCHGNDKGKKGAPSGKGKGHKNNDKRDRDERDSRENYGRGDRQGRK